MKDALAYEMEIWAQLNEREARIATVTHRIVDTYPVAQLPEEEYIKAGLEEGHNNAVNHRRKLRDEETEHDKAKKRAIVEEAQTHNSYLTPSLTGGILA